MPQADVQSVTKDQNFLGLPKEEKRKVLLKVDPNFGALPPKDQDDVLGKLNADLPGTGFFGAMKEDVKDLYGKAKDYATKTPAGKMELDIATAPAKMAASAVNPVPIIRRGYHELASSYPGEENDNLVERGAKRLGRAEFSALGGSPENVDQRLKQGDKGGAAYEFLKPAGALIGAEVGGRQLAKLPGLSEEAIPTEAVGRKNLASLGSVIPSVTKDEDIIATGSDWKGTIQDLRQAARDIGLSDKDLEGAFPGREVDLSHPVKSYKEYDPNQFRVQKGVETGNKLFERAEKNYNDVFQEIVHEYGDTKPPAELGRDLGVKVRGALSSSERAAAKPLANAVDSIAQDLESKSFTNLGELDNYRKDFGKRASDAYAAVQRGDTSVSMDSVNAYRHAANAIRDAEYDLLAKYSGMDVDELRDFQRRHGNLVAAKQARTEAFTQGRAATLAHQNNAIQQALVGRSGERSVSKEGFFSRSFRKSPHGEVNVATRKALSGMGEGGSAPSVTRSQRTAKSLPAPAVEIPTEVQQILTSKEPYSVTGIRVEHPQGPKQLPPISSVDVSTGSREPEVMGGVENNREELGGPTRIRDGEPPVGGLSRLPEKYAYERNPLFVTDYEGSGARGEEPLMPGNKRAQLAIRTPEEAKKALRGYRKFKSSKEYAKMDPSRQQRIDETTDRLEAFAKQGEVGLPRIGAKVTETQVEGAPSEITGQNAGVMSVKTPEQAKQMLSRLEGFDTSNLDAGTRQKIQETIESLRRMSQMGTAGTPTRKLKINPGVPGRVNKQVRNTTAARGITLPGAITAERSLPDLGKDQDEE